MYIHTFNCYQKCGKIIVAKGAYRRAVGGDVSVIGGDVTNDI